MWHSIFGWNGSINLIFRVVSRCDSLGPTQGQHTAPRCPQARWIILTFFGVTVCVCLFAPLFTIHIVLVRFAVWVVLQLLLLDRCYPPCPLPVARFSSEKYTIPKYT